MATGIEIKDLPEIPLTHDTKMLCQNVDGTGSATLMNAREAIGVTLDRADVSAVVTDAGTEPTVALSVTGTDQHKEMDFAFTLPMATEIVGVTADTEVLEADGHPSVAVETGGTASQRTYGFSFGLPKAMDITETTAEAAVIPAGENATAEVTRGGTASERTLHFSFGIPKGDPGVITEVTAELARGTPDSASTVEVVNGGIPSERTIHLKFSLPEVPAIVPVGFVYVQFPGQPAPDAVFGGTWQNISANFAGRFFRAEGGNAAAFGTAQGESLPNIKGSWLTWAIGGPAVAMPTVDSTVGWEGGPTYRGLPKGIIDFSASRANAIYGGSHVTPLNYAVRIWKRTA